jgi:hypothetical protein
MTTISAFARVSANETHRAARPDRARIDCAAKQLQQCGFELLDKSRFGVSIAGRASLYRDVFDVRVEPSKRFSAAVDPRWKALSGLVIALDIAEPPQMLEA